MLAECDVTAPCDAPESSNTVDASMQADPTFVRSVGTQTSSYKLAEKATIKSVATQTKSRTLQSIKTKETGVNCRLLPSGRKLESGASIGEPLDYSTPAKKRKLCYDEYNCDEANDINYAQDTTYEPSLDSDT